MKRKIKFPLALLAFVSVFSSLYGRSSQEVVGAGSWIFDSLSRVVMDQGRTDFVFHAPMTLEEVECHLDAVDHESLSADAMRHYDRIRQYISYDSHLSFGHELLKLQAELDVNLEGYYKTEDDLDWVYDYYRQKPFVYLPLKIVLGDWCAMSMDGRVGITQGYKIKDDNYTNIPLDVDGIDLNFPHDYYFASGHRITEKTGFSFIYGTMPSCFNRSLSGSVTQSEYFTGSTYADLSIYSSNFRYRLDVNQFNPDRYMYSHEIAAILFDRLQLTARESLFVYAPLELRYLAPWNIFHGIAAWKDYETRREGGESNTCDYMSLKVDFTPARNSRLYGIFVMDQFQMPNESDDENDVTPRGFGFQAGAEFFIPHGDGTFHVWVEGTYTDPYMYIKASPAWSLVRYYQDLTGPMQDDFYTEWYGTPWGPDTAGGELSIGYEKAGVWSVTLDYVFKACGEYSGNKIFRNLDWNWKNRDKMPESDSVASSSDSKYSKWPYPSRDNDGKVDSTGSSDDAKKRQEYSTPHGSHIEYVNRISLRGTLTPVENLTFMVQPSYTHVTNYGNQSGRTKSGFEIAVSVSKKFF